MLMEACHPHGIKISLSHYTPSVPKCKASKISQKSTLFKFDQVYIEKYEYLEFLTNISRFTIKYIFSIFLLNIVDVDTFSEIFGQN
jgi:hypothetical protein